MIAYWRGVPINEMPRDELEREFIAAHEEIAHLQRDVCDRSIAQVRDLAASKRLEIHRKHMLLRWLG